MAVSSACPVTYPQSFLPVLFFLDHITNFIQQNIKTLVKHFFRGKRWRRHDVRNELILLTYTNSVVRTATWKKLSPQDREIRKTDFSR